MNSKLLLILALAAPGALAQTTDQRTTRLSQIYAFDDHRFASVFERTLILGHSISADFMQGLVSKSLGPGTVLSRYYAGHEPLANLSEPRDLSVLEVSMNSYYVPQIKIGLETGLNKMRRLIDQEDDESSTNRRLSTLNDLYQKSTAIVGIDALYLSATTSFGDCWAMDVPSVIDRFTKKAFEDGKVVILGNVPREDRSSFGRLWRLAVYPPDEGCRTSINRALKQYCTPERNCYVVDLEKDVRDLETNGFLPLWDGSRLLHKGRGGVNQVRPDGVNLSVRGSRFVCEQVLDVMKANPPRPMVIPPLDAR